MATSRVIDDVATRRRHARLIMDVHRAFFHHVEDKQVLVDPPQIWNDEILWQMHRVLHGRRKAPREWLDFFTGKFWRSIRASGLLTCCKRSRIFAESSVAVKHPIIFPAGENAIFEHFRRERIVTAEGCLVGTNRKHAERSAFPLGLDNRQLVATLFAGQRLHLSIL